MSVYRQEKDLKRWYPLKDIPEQLALINDGVRFPVVPAGRRSGKTERFKRFVAKSAMRTPGEMFFIAAPTRDQVKKIYWSDMKQLCFASSCQKKPSETELIITMDNGATVNLIGLDQPARIEGVPWYGGGIDEIADVKPGAWEEHIRPALDTHNPLKPNHKIWCWLIGVPDGLNHYYKMAKYAQESGDPEWKYYHWNSSAILSPEAIESARRQMSPRQFRQEYEASFETVDGRVYSDFDRKLNSTHEKVEPTDKAIHIGMDFNVHNMTAVIHVIRDGQPLAVDEFTGLRDTPSMAKAIKAKYPDKRLVVYPDASGGSASTLNASISDLTILKDAGFIVQANPANPHIKDRVNAVNAMVCNSKKDRRYLVNEETCPITVENLEQQVYGKDGKPDKTAGKDHSNDALGYFINFRWPINRRIISTQNVGF